MDPDARMHRYRWVLYLSKLWQVLCLSLSRPLNQVHSLHMPPAVLEYQLKGSISCHKQSIWSRVPLLGGPLSAQVAVQFPLVPPLVSMRVLMMSLHFFTVGAKRPPTGGRLSMNVVCHYDLILSFQIFNEFSCCSGVSVISRYSNVWLNRKSNAWAEWLYVKVYKLSFTICLMHSSFAFMYIDMFQSILCISMREHLKKHLHVWRYNA